MKAFYMVNIGLELEESQTIHPIAAPKLALAMVPISHLNSNSGSKGLKYNGSQRQPNVSTWSISSKASVVTHGSCA